MRSHWDIYETPETIEEVVDCLAKYGENAAVIAGGTDLMVDLDQNDRFREALIDISRISELGEIHERENRIVIGAGATLAKVASQTTIRELCPVLVEAINTIGSVQIRNIATLVGNVANASPAADGAIPLLALDSEVVMVSQRGRRVVPLPEFFTGPGQSVCKPDELIVELQFDKPSSTTFGAFEKIGLRHAMAIAVVNAASIVTFEGGHVSKARISLGSVAPTPVLAHRAERCLIGTSLGEEVIIRSGELAVESCSPIDDVRSGAVYREKIVPTLTSRALHRIKTQFEVQGEGSRPQVI